MVAVKDGAATTALSDVDECNSGKRKRRKRSIVEDQPFATTLAEDMILPSRCEQLYLYLKLMHKFYL